MSNRRHIRGIAGSAASRRRSAAAIASLLTVASASAVFAGTAAPALADQTPSAASAASSSFQASGATPFGSAMSQVHLNAAVVGITSTHAGDGAWLVARDGGVFTLGDAGFHGSTGNIRLNQPVNALASTPDDAGYWLAASDGGVFTFGNASFRGSMGGSRLNAPTVGIASTKDGGGYWMAASDGGVFAFGDAAFEGSMGRTRLSQPVTGMQATSTGRGYWMVARDGGVFAFGDAGFYGSAAGMTHAPVVGMAVTSDGNGYWIIASDGEVFAFGDAAFAGSAASHAAQDGPAMSVASTPGGGYFVTMANGAVYQFGTAPAGAPSPGNPVNPGAPGAPANPGAPAAPPVNSLTQVTNDMTQANTVFPAGVPSSWSWYQGPEIKAGNTPPAGYSALTGWGLVYPAASGTSDTNTRVELRNEETWVYSKSQQQWLENQNSAQPNGSFYYQDLHGNLTAPANVRSEPDGGMSIKMVPGYCFQFFPQGSRPTINAADIGGVYTTVEARLVVDNPAQPADVAQANYVVNVGGDYWMNATAPYPNNAEIFMSRFQAIGASYGSVSASTLSSSQLAQTPPPIDAAP